MNTTTISPDFPFTSQFLEVEGAKMHYIDEGAGDPMLFLHGNPTSVYLWRNIIPHLIPHARCIGVDLIGMGKSDKPDSDYRFEDHYLYVKGFIDKMDLDNLTLVIHDWGSALGFHYAHQHPDRIKGLAFMEAIIKPIKWSNFPLPFRMMFYLMRTSGVGWFLINVMNIFVKQILPMSIVRPLSDEEKAAYAAPYPTTASLKPVRQWPREIPGDGQPADVVEIVSSYYQWLKQTPIPKLLFYAKPGGLIPPSTAEWIEKNFPNTTTVFLGKGLHYVQEDHPHLIGEELKKWYLGLEQA